jgi:cobalt/nickel transport system permease protein
MFGDLSLEHTSSKDSALADLDPRSKIFSALLLIVTILSLTIHTPSQILVLSIFLLILIIGSQKPVRLYGKAILRILPMVLVLTIILPFKSYSVSENPLHDWQYLSLYESGLERFLIINIKLLLVVSVSLIFLYTTSLSKILQGLEAFRLPAWLTAVLYYMVYFIYLLKEELFRQYLSYKSRYIQLPLRQKVRIISRMVAVYFIRIIERSERNTLAMISRGFTGRVFTQRSLHWRTSDSVFMFGVILFIVIMKVYI